jgi:hypothetical protein
LEPAKKKQIDEAANDDPDSTVQSGEPDKETIRKLLAQSDDESDDDEPNKSRVKLEDDVKEESEEKLLENVA